MYVINKAFLVGDGASIELRLVSLSNGTPLVLAGAVKQGATKPSRWSKLVGEHIEGPLAYAKPLADPKSIQVEVPRPPVYVAEPVREVRHPGYIVVEHGSSRRAISLDTIVGEAEWVQLDLHCVTGWSLRGRKWLALRLDNLLGPLPKHSCWLLGFSATGYVAVTHCSLASSTYIVLGYDGKPLAREHGGPARLLSPRLFGWKHVKWLVRLVVSRNYLDGYWEALGYHERGLVEAEERYKIRNPEIA
jgi:hypothetical protein